MAKKREKLSCGCRIAMAQYPKHPWNNWGRVDVLPSCTKPNHFSDLESLKKSMEK